MRSWIEKIIPAAWLPYFLHLRPAAWAIIIAHMTVGFLIALDSSSVLLHWRQWLLAAVSWGVFGAGGTLAINSAYDRDEGDIGYLNNPPPVPPHLALFSLVWMGIGAGFAMLLGWQYLILYSICVVLSVLYSVPPFRWKARAGLDVLINSSGFGSLTILAGWVASGRAIEFPMGWIALAFFFLFLGFYPLTQIYQFEEDSRRGDSTLALALGKQAALWVSLGSVMIAFAVLAVAVFNQAVNVRSLGYLIALGAWLFLLIPWVRQYDRWSTAREQRGFYRALTAWALTDLAVVISMMS